VVPRLRSLYRVEAEFPRPVERPGDWRLEAVDPKGQKLDQVLVIYPRRVIPFPAEMWSGPAPFSGP
jgi:hypothetical protein